MTDSTDNEDDISYTYIGNVNEHLICPICRQPFISPVQTQCGHTFCLSCITQSLQSSSLCPIDRLTISAEEIKAAPKIVGALVNELMVSCPRGCAAEVERGSLRGHLSGRCDMEIITCECGEKCTRGEQREVLETSSSAGGEGGKEEGECIHTYRQCKSCETNIQRLHWKSHLQCCPNQQSPCPHCDTLIANSSVSEHFKTCPSHPISCPHATLGCHSTIPRSELSTHLATCPFTPLSPLLNTLLTRLSNLESQPPPPPDPEIDRLRVDLDILNQALGDLEIRFSNAVVSERIRMGEEVERLRGQVGALRREVWFTRRRDGLEMLSPPGTGGGGAAANGGGGGVRAEVLPRRLSGTGPGFGGYADF